MKQIRILLIFIFFSSNLAKAQQMKYEMVMAKVKAELQTIVPKHLLPFTQLYYSPYYLIDNGEEEWQLLEQGKDLIGRLKMMKVRYELKVPHTGCPQYENVQTILELEFNQALKIVNYKGLEVVPTFVLKNTPCKLMTTQKAAEIAKSYGVNADPSWFSIEYDSFDKKFQYIATQETANTEESTIIIDAQTGELLANTFK